VAVTRASRSLPDRSSRCLRGSILVSVADGRRAPAARSTYHELDRDLQPREGVVDQGKTVTITPAAKVIGHYIAERGLHHDVLIEAGAHSSIAQDG
jgi:hypothetical protein